MVLQIIPSKKWGQSTKGETICKLYLTRDLNLEYTKNNYNSMKKKDNPIFKWAKDLNRHFSKEDIQMANKHTEQHSTSWILRKWQIRTIAKHHFVLIRMANLKKIDDKKFGKVWRKLEPSNTDCRNVYKCNHCENQYSSSSNVKHNCYQTCKFYL